MPRMTTAAAAATLALALSACGGDGGPGPTAGDGNSSTPAAPSTSDGDPNDSTPTSSATSTTGTESETGDEESTEPTAGDPSDTSSSSSTSTNTGKPFDADEFTGKLEAAVQKNPTAAIEVTADIGQASPVKANGVQDLENDELEMTLGTGDSQVRYRVVDGEYYLSQPPKWVLVTQDSTNPLMKEALSQVSVLSMRKQFDAFVAGVESAGTKGTEEIDGVKTTHYTATVDTAKALRELDLTKSDGTPDQAIYDVWLDEDDLIRKMSFTQNGANTVVTAKDWGKPVDITKPKDSELASGG